MKKAIKAYLKLFTRPTIEEIAAAKAKAAAQTIEETNHTIRSQKFVRYMAKAELEAVTNWMNYHKDSE